MTEKWNPRFANYARVHGNSPVEQLAEDRNRWPGGSMTGFVLWNRERLVEASRAIPEAFCLGRLVDHETYDAWLTAWVDTATKTVES